MGRKLRKCKLGSKCPFQNEHQHVSEYSHHDIQKVTRKTRQRNKRGSRAGVPSASNSQKKFVGRGRKIAMPARRKAEVTRSINGTALSPRAAAANAATQRLNEARRKRKHTSASRACSTALGRTTQGRVATFAERNLSSRRIASNHSERTAKRERNLTAGSVSGPPVSEVIDLCT